MPKKKAPTKKSTKPENNSKKIISVQHRDIKATGRKHDNGYLEFHVWLPLWELPMWLASDGGATASAIAVILAQLLQGGGHE